jgi:low affinity Fe/Cu permease
MHRDWLLAAQSPHGAEIHTRPSVFHRIAHRTSQAMGTSIAFCIALAIVLVWGILGPFFHFSDTWQLAINTGTTIVTFLMVFLVQNTQNRDSAAIHLKLDELIVALDAARNQMVAVEDLDDASIRSLEGEFRRLAVPADPECASAPSRKPR